MQLDAVQDKIIKSKPYKVSLLKGVNSAGKTTTAVHRTHYLKNNYCLYDNDKIMVIAKDSLNRDIIRNMYNKIEDYTKHDYQTLFSNAVDRVDIFTIEDIINRYYFEYTNSEKKWYKIIQDSKEKIKILEQCLIKVSSRYSNLKLINKDYINFLLEEIEWIKACNYRELDVYQNCERIGRKYLKASGPSRLLKKSKERHAIHELYQCYNLELENNGLLDIEDIPYLALIQAKREECATYTHIIVDEGQALTKTQIDFVRELQKNTVYSSLLFTVNKSDELNYKAWFVKRRKIKALDLDSSVKTYNLNKVFEEIKEEYTNESEETSNLKKSNNGSLECFEFIDLKHHRKIGFKRDSDYQRELIIEENGEEDIYTEENLAQVNVYSDIAAGEPIMMSSEQESEFYLPENWLKNSEQCFILKVKGDSMIGANIFDQDLVVVKKQNTAQNGDIVAADLEGSATLKRLSLNKEVPMLMPENDKYSPIFLHDRQVSILGVVVGIIKNMN